MIIEAPAAIEAIGAFFRLKKSINHSPEPLTEKQALNPCDAYHYYGALNLRDRYSYALAKEIDIPLGYKRADFWKIDVKKINS